MPTRALKIYIDSCAINVLHENSVNLTAEFPEYDYELIITKGVQQEILDIPEDNPVKGFALSLIASQRIGEESFLGFCDLEDPENNLRYIGGFNSGSFATDEQLQFLVETHKNLGSPRKSKLRKNETDRDLLALGLGAVVLTKENKVGGALQAEAESRGTLIINVSKWPPTGLSLNKYVEQEIKRRASTEV